MTFKPLVVAVLLFNFASCYHANGQPFTPAEVGQEAVVISHVIAKGLCLARPLEAALAISHGLTMEPAIADLFCSAVAAFDVPLMADANRVVSARQTARLPPMYLVGSRAFSVRMTR